MGGIEGVEPQSSEEMGDNKHVTTVKWQDSDGNWHYALEVSPTSVTAIVEPPTGGFAQEADGNLAALVANTKPLQTATSDITNETATADGVITVTTNEDGSVTYTFPTAMNGINILNTSTSTSMSFIIGGLTTNLAAGQGYRDRFPSFLAVTVSSGADFVLKGLQNV